MAPRNPLAEITLKATEKVAERAVGVVAVGARLAASLISSVAERTPSGVGTQDEKDAPTAPPAAPVDSSLESVVALAEAAVAREMAEEPLTTPTPPRTARVAAPTKTPKPKNAAQPDDEPLIDPAIAKAVKSETDILRAAADTNKDL